MDLLKKLNECETRFKEVSELVMDPNLVKDAKKYKDTMREHGYLSELCELSAQYKKVRRVGNPPRAVTQKSSPGNSRCQRNDYRRR